LKNWLVSIKLVGIFLFLYCSGNFKKSPMRPSQILKKLRNSQPVLLTTLHLADPSVFELASLMGFDGIWLDMEHHAHSLETAQNLMRATRVGQSDILVRPAKGEFMRMGRMLEAGAQGIMYPRCDNAAEAREVVKWAKFPPLGKRGIDGGGADMPYCSMPVAEYIQEANQQTFVVIQIEEEAALNNIEEIAAVEGVDVLFLGPGDFSTLGGYAGQFEHPRLEKATERVAAAARRTGKHWGRPIISSTEEAEKYLAMGARFLAYSADIVLVKLGLEKIQRDFAAIGFEFNNQLPGQATQPPKSTHRLPGPHLDLAGSLATNGRDASPVAAAK
jgi:4-hydroxy-2-oxoheptanedioate aldolase